MGIKQLMKLLSDEADGSFKETEKSNYMGRTVAIDASMQLYQFMVQIRSAGAGGGPAQQLANDAGEVTSHLQGFFYRTITLLEKGLRPVFVFDGKPPELKIEELRKRKDLKAAAEESAEAAKAKLEQGDKSAVEDIDKANKRATRVTKEHNEDVQKLLTLMGLPIVCAPGEAEAQCAELCKKGKVFAAGTDDMDALTFGTPILLKRLTMPERQMGKTTKAHVQEIHLDKVLHLLKLDMDQFIDLCILCGCDYCPNVRGIGPKTALKLMRDHGSLEKVLASLDKTKYQVPEVMLERLGAIRDIFRTPEVSDGAAFDFKFSPVDDDKLIDFLCREKGFNEDRVKSALGRLQKSKSQTSQKRLDSFFKPAAASGAVTGFKRKGDAKGAKGASKRGGRGRRGRR